MIVVPGTSSIHAETFARALGCQVLSGEPTPEDAAFFVGITPELAPTVAKYKELGAKTIAYWIGSDSMTALQSNEYRSKIPVFDQHLVVHERIRDELKSWNVPSEVVYPCARGYMRALPPPPTPCVGVYAPTPVPGDLYMFEECAVLAKENPDLPFLFYGMLSPLPTGLTDNCQDAGRMEPEETKDLYEKVSVLLRLCKHDGNPIGGIEAKMRNRHVIENYPYQGFLCAETLEDVNTILRDPAVHQGDEGPWPSWYREHCSPKGFDAAVRLAVGMYRTFDCGCQQTPDPECELLPCPKHHAPVPVA